MNLDSPHIINSKTIPHFLIKGITKKAKTPKIIIFNFINLVFHKKTRYFNLIMKKLKDNTSCQVLTYKELQNTFPYFFCHNLQQRSKTINLFFANGYS